MTSICPLCGKNKPEEALFCQQCAKKIRSDYEVDVPETATSDNTLEEVDIPQPQQDTQQDTQQSIQEAEQEDETPERQSKPLFRRVAVLLLVLFSAALLAGGLFFFYDNTPRHRPSATEQIDWERAVSGNTIAHYLAFIEAHPRSERIDLARENILKLRQLEQQEWEKLRQSNSIAELQDFLNQFPESVLRPLVVSRIDSLEWAERWRIEEAQRRAAIVADSIEVQTNVPY